MDKERLTALTQSELNVPRSADRNRLSWNDDDRISIWCRSHARGKVTILQYGFQDGVGRAGKGTAKILVGIVIH